MSSVLRNLAVASINKGAPSSYYSDSKSNPVLQKLHQELDLFVNFVKKKSSPGYKRQQDESFSRA